MSLRELASLDLVVILINLFLNAFYLLALRRSLVDPCGFPGNIRNKFIFYVSYAGENSSSVGQR